MKKVRFYHVLTTYKKIRDICYSYNLVRNVYERTVYAIVLEEHKNKTTKMIKGHKYSTCRTGR